jgi:hypothetical protein
MESSGPNPHLGSSVEYGLKLLLQCSLRRYRLDLPSFQRAGLQNPSPFQYQTSYLCLHNHILSQV